MRKREIYIENFNTNSIKNMAYEPVVYHGQQAFLRSYIRIERAKRAMLLERQFKKMVAIRIYAFSIRICVLSCILYLIEYKFIQVMKQKIHKRVFSYIKYICCIDGISLWNLQNWLILWKKRKDDYKYEYDFKNKKSLQIVQRADSRK